MTPQPQHPSPAQLLQQITPGHPEFNDAIRGLQRLLQRLARSRRIAFIQDPDFREELVQWALFKLVNLSSTGALPVAASGDGAALAYLAQMLRNRTRDEHRRRRGRQALEGILRGEQELAAQGAREAEEAGEVPIEDRKDEAWALIEGAYRAARARRRPRDRAALEQGYDELVRLARGCASMDMLLEEAGARPDMTRTARTRLRNAMLQRHTRTREALLAALVDQGVPRDRAAMLMGLLYQHVPANLIGADTPGVRTASSSRLPVQETQR